MASFRSPWRRTTARTASGSRTAVALRFWPKPAMNTGLPPSTGVMSASPNPASSGGSAAKQGFTTKAQRAQRKPRNEYLDMGPLRVVFVFFVPSWLCFFTLAHVPDALAGNRLGVGGVVEHLDRHPA